MTTVTKILTHDKSGFWYIDKDDESFDDKMKEINSAPVNKEEESKDGSLDAYFASKISDKGPSVLDLNLENDKDDHEFIVHIDVSIREFWEFDTEQKGKLKAPKKRKRTFCIDCDYAKLDNIVAHKRYMLSFVCKAPFNSTVFDMHLLNKNDLGNIKVILDPIIRNPT